MPRGIEGGPDQRRAGGSGNGHANIGNAADLVRADTGAGLNKDRKPVRWAGEDCDTLRAGDDDPGQARQAAGPGIDRTTVGIKQRARKDLIEPVLVRIWTRSHGNAVRRC